MTRRILVRAAGAAKSWNAAFTHFLKAGNDALLRWLPHCPGGGIDRSRWRKFYSSSPGPSRWVDGGSSRPHSLLVCRGGGPGRCPFLSGGKRHLPALSLATVVGRSVWASIVA